MRYCSKCGAELNPDSAYCHNCGCPVGGYAQSHATVANSGLKTVVKVLMIISCVLKAFLVIPLFWSIPMTVVYWNSVNNRVPIGVGFKICTLLFVSLIAGILMLCDDER